MAAQRDRWLRQRALSALRVHLIPGGSRDSIDGRATDAHGKALLKARVRAAPENFAANRALEAMIAKTIGVAKTKVKVTRGQTARLKTLEIEGVSDADVADFIASFEAK